MVISWSNKAPRILPNGKRENPVTGIWHWTGCGAHLRLRRNFGFSWFPRIWWRSPVQSLEVESVLASRMERRGRQAFGKCSRGLEVKGLDTLCIALNWVWGSINRGFQIKKRKKKDLGSDSANPALACPGEDRAGVWLSWWGAYLEDLTSRPSAQ